MYEKLFALREKYKALAEKIDNEEDIPFEQEQIIYAILGLRRISVTNPKFSVLRFFDVLEDLLKVEEV